MLRQRLRNRVAGSRTIASVLLVLFQCGIAPAQTWRFAWAPLDTPVDTNAGKERGGAQSRDNDPLLTQGTPVQREIASDEKHYCRLTLTAGQYVFLAVDQRRVDLRIALYGPDGTKLVEADRQHKKQGAERIWLIAPASGEYRLEVARVDLDGTRGFYRAEIAELRPATSKDSLRIPVLEAEDNATCLLFWHTGESLKRAVEEFINVSYRWHELGNGGSEGYSLYLAGEACNQVGDYEKGIALLDRALAIREFISDSAERASALITKGESYYYSSRYQEALACYEASLELCEGIKRGDVEAWALNNVGSVYDALGDKPRALAYYLRSLAVYENWDRGSDARGIALTNTNVGGVYAAIGNSDKALEHLTRALPLWRQVEDKWGEARVLHRIGLAYALSGQHREALDSYKQALILWRDQGDRFNEAKTLDAAGLLCQIQGDKASALDLFDSAIAVRISIGDRQGAANTLYSRARAERESGKLTESRRDIEQAIEWAESVRSGVSNEELKSSYLAQSRDYYDFYVNLLMNLHHTDPSKRLDETALEVSEGARARCLIELLAEGQVDVREGVDSRLVDRERAVERRLSERAAFQTRLMGTGRTTDAADVQKELETLGTDLQETKARIRSASPHYAAITQPQPLTLEEIRREVLDPDSLLLEYFLGEAHSYLWAVTADRLNCFELPSAAEIEKPARRFYGLLTTRNERKAGETAWQRRTRIERADAELVESARSLSRVLLGPVAASLGEKRLVVVADGALQYIPFQSLQSPAVGLSGASASAYRPLVIDHEIVSLPSASALAVLRRETRTRPSASRGIAVIADPVFSAEDPRVRRSLRGGNALASQAPRNASRRVPLVREADVERSLRDVGLADDAIRIPRLPLARDEAQSILSLVPPTERLAALNFEASKALATDPKLAQYRIVHFATHGLLNSTHPELSGLVLSLVDPSGRLQDGFFRLHEIYNLRLPADLVVLSACQTGLGKEIRGEGLVGLTRGFMYAGAKSVVASLWKIDDRATAALMKRFYEGMLGAARLTPAESLRKAQIEMWKTGNWSHPYYWAAFVLQGEWK